MDDGRIEALEGAGAGWVDERVRVDGRGLLASDDRLVSVDARLCALFGHAAEELVSAPIYDFVHEDDRGRVRLDLSGVRRGSSPWVEVVLRVRARNGVFAHFRMTCVRDVGTELVRVSVLDVTEERDQAERTELAIDRAPMGILMIDGTGTIVLANRQIEALFGYTRDELIGETVEVLVPERAQGAHGRVRAGYGRSESSRPMGLGREVSGRRKDGSQFPIEVQLAPITTSRGPFVLASVQDITARLAQEEEMRRHLRELSQHRQEMALLGEMSSFLQHATHEREAVDVVTAYGPRLFPDAGATVYLLPPSRDALERAAHWGEGAPADGLDPNDCWALRRALPRKWAPADPAPCRHYGSAPTGHHVCVPMAAHGTVLGLVTISAPTAEGLHETSARSIADQLGLALSNLQLRETLRSMSIRDPLTGLFNRRYLEETALREVNRAKRRSQPLTVLMIDADHFKRLNDTHGHDKGDEALRVIGRVLRDNVRGEDAPCRLGGEELVVLLGDCSYENGLARAEQIRAQVRQATHPQVTLSIGVASYPEHAGTWTDLLRAADQAVYRAKAEGRDRVVGAAPTT